MTTASETPVLIVGAGPVGLALALDLARRGVRSTVVERGTAKASLLPAKAGTLNERTMELLRQWGIADQVRDWGCPQDYPRDNVYCTSLVGGHLIGRSEVPSALERAQTPGSPEILRKCPQFILDPILAREATATGLVELEYGVRLTDLVETHEGVMAQLVDDAGQERRVSVSYVVGCDGAGSTVRRLLGIPFEGPTLDYSITVIVEIDGLEGYHPYGRAERFLFMGPNGVWCNATSMDYGRNWRFTLLGFDTEPDLSTIDAEAEVRRAMGTATIPFTILGVVPWRRSQCAATTFGRGRVLLAGDSAHTTSPTGGHGLNTGFGDVSDLGWMLEACLSGWGDEGLLLAYSHERRPVAVRNSSISSGNYSKWVEAVDYSEVLDDGPAGEAARKAIGQRLVHSLHGEWNSQGVGLGYRYEGSPIIVPDGTPEPPDEVSTFVQTARPGHRAPHVYLTDGRSTLDLFGDGFVLLRLGDAPPEVTPLVRAAAAAGLPLRVVDLDEPQAVAAYGRRLVLVRPDAHVAWRGDSVLDDPGPEVIVDTVRGAHVRAVDEQLAGTVGPKSEDGQ